PPGPPPPPPLSSISLLRGREAYLDELGAEDVLSGLNVGMLREVAPRFVALAGVVAAVHLRERIEGPRPRPCPCPLLHHLHGNACAEPRAGRLGDERQGLRIARALEEEGRVEAEAEDGGIEREEVGLLEERRHRLAAGTD